MFGVRKIHLDLHLLFSRIENMQILQWKNYTKKNCLAEKLKLKSLETTKVNENQGAEVEVVLETPGVVSVVVLVADSVVDSAMVLQIGAVLVVASEVPVALHRHFDLGQHSVDPLHHIVLKGEIGSTNLIASQEICLYEMTSLRLDMEGWMIGV